MVSFLLVCTILLWAAVLFLGFLLLGTLRSIGILSWRLEQLDMIMPRRVARDGLRIGAKAPDFTLPNVKKESISLHDFAGRKVLLVFTQTGCAPCDGILPDLERAHRKGEAQVVVINHGDTAGKAGTPFPVLEQEEWSVSKRYQVFATPFAFVIDEKGIIRAKGVVSSSQHIRYVLSGVRSSTRESEALSASTPNADEGSPERSPGDQVGS